MSTARTQIQPYLFFDGRCDEAVEFYRRAVGAEVVMLMRYKDSPDPGMAPPGMSDKIMHGNLKIGDSTVLVSDGHAQGKPSFAGFALSLTVANETEAERFFGALSQDGADAADQDLLLAQLRDAHRSLRRVVDGVRPSVRPA